MRARILLAWALLLGGCVHPAPIVESRIGRSTRPFYGTPEWMELYGPPLPSEVGVFSDRVPVANFAGRPRDGDRLDHLRVVLAEIDTLAVGLRAQARPADVQELSERAGEVGALVSRRSDLIAEAQEIGEIARLLPTAGRLRRGQLVDRLGQLTDLIRLQVDVV
jgi:hypothetical protein